MARRIAALLAVCIVLGAATTVGVAWALAKLADLMTVSPTWARSTSGPYPNPQGGRPLMTVTVEFRTMRGAELVRSLVTREVLRDYDEGGLLPPPSVPALPDWCYSRVAAHLQRHAEPLTDARSVLVVEARGWPALALACEHLSPRTTTNGIAVGSRTRGFGFPVALPCRPIWRGIAINIGTYAGAWVLLLLAPSGVIGAARRSRRKKHGQCVRCGYDLRSAPGACPECGAAPPGGPGPR